MQMRTESSYLKLYTPNNSKHFLKTSFWSHMFQTLLLFHYWVLGTMGHVHVTILPLTLNFDVMVPNELTL